MHLVFAEYEKAVNETPLDVIQSTISHQVTIFEDRLKDQLESHLTKVRECQIEDTKQNILPQINQLSNGLAKLMAQ